MESELGVCPSCEASGPVGTPCATRPCARHGLHLVPGEYAARAAERPSAQREPLVGHVIGDYLVVDALGRGGFGRVLLALQQPRHRLKAALKLLHFEGVDGDMVGRLHTKFEGEADALATLTHPNVVRLLKFGVHEGAPFLAMEFVEGGRTLLSERRALAAHGKMLAPERVRRIVGQVLDALESAHDEAIVHRDIKPENVMLQAIAGNPDFVRVLDFGLAKFVEERTETSLAMGTPLYMAPEQLDRHNIGPWTDLYALGAIAFELLTDRRPFPGSTQREVLAQKLDPRFDPCAALADLDLPPARLALLRRALARDPADRFRSAAAFRTAWEASWEGPSGAAGLRARLRETEGDGTARRAADEGRRFLEDARRAASAGSQPMERPYDALPPDPAPSSATLVELGGMAWAVVPAGRFWMGSAEDETGAEPRERPRHEVVFAAPFWMKQTAVTRDEWRRLMGTDPGGFFEDEPVRDVNWYEAVAFCNALSRATGLPEAYVLAQAKGTPGVHGLLTRSFRATVRVVADSEGFRLPSEAEWEYACRAGEAEPRFRPVELVDTSIGRMARRLRTNAWGLRGMLGDHYEWCEDDYALDYAKAPRDGSSFSEGSSDYRSRRGGYLLKGEPPPRPGARSFDKAGDRTVVGGFRCVRHPAPVGPASVTDPTAPLGT